MKTLHFDILIHAPREHVWRSTLFSPTYERWTATFSEGSRYEGSWEAGTPIRFCGPNGDGMVAEIAEHRPAEFVSIRHLGMVTNGVEDTTSEAVRAWTPCFENYTFSDEAGGTRVRVDVDVFGTHEDWMAQTWPEALLALKAVCETPT
ncbi:MAG: SRPBCC domain-containing protein [Hydrogenophaga sp.]|uniref:SRPBCC family protein n=1 Tax=Hydrogenophaga sp. TaxID=1904254 RepID=UPI0025BD154D|nr:SRPBCC domain-containing protein [Hydrogenophaga sp.]MBT9552643.1 SRPBCC domain-containing protein [Hydrogenophaga sp.]